MQKLIKLILKDNFLLIVALFTTFLIAFLSLMPTGNLPDIKFDKVDKAYHFIAYMFLSFSWFCYYCIGRKQDKFKILVLINCLLIVFGIVIEILQKNLTDYRTFDWWDILFNTAAIVFVFIIFEVNKTKLGNLSHRLNV